MGFACVDDYLLGEPVSKADAVAALLAERTDDDAAAPFYRALEAVGVRAADEALIALRLVLAKRAPEDGAVRRLRALAGIVRATALEDRGLLAKILKRDRDDLGDVGAIAPENMRSAARAAYFAELGVR